MITFYGADPAIMSLLLAISSGIGIFFAPFVGRMIDKLGYKVVMLGDSFFIIVVCLIYGFAHVIFPKEIAFFVVCVSFVMDALISMGRMAANVYAKRISSSQEEITATLSTGISVDHVISISMALLGGWIWRLTGFEVLFTFSALLGLAKCLYTLTIKNTENSVRPSN